MSVCMALVWGLLCVCACDTNLNRKVVVCNRMWNNVNIGSTQQNINVHTYLFTCRLLQAIMMTTCPWRKSRRNQCCISFCLFTHQSCLIARKDMW